MAVRLVLTKHFHLLHGATHLLEILFYHDTSQYLFLLYKIMYHVIQACDFWMCSHIYFTVMYYFHLPTNMVDIKQTTNASIIMTILLSEITHLFFKDGSSDHELKSLLGQVTETGSVSN